MASSGAPTGVVRWRMSIIEVELAYSTGAPFLVSCDSTTAERTSALWVTRTPAMVTGPVALLRAAGEVPVGIVPFGNADLKKDELEKWKS